MRRCAGRATSERNRRHRELRRLGDGAWKARPSTVCSSQPTSRHPNDAPRGASVQAGLQTGNGEQPKPRQCAPQGATAARPRFSNRAEHPAPVGARKSTVKSKSLRDTPCSGEPIRTSFERSTSDSLNCSQSTRAAEVEALVSTPLRRPRPDPGSGLVSGRCAPPLGETVETSTASAQAESASSVAFRDRLRTRTHPSSRRWMRLHRQPH